MNDREWVMREIRRAAIKEGLAGLAVLGIITVMWIALWSL